ncbi:MAG: phosphate ABC transporter permease PstA [Natrialbaceae archaeon]|nr:phosphate ABC transporter permease PstA [Natrialbaceae archaeon]
MPSERVETPRFGSSCFRHSSFPVGYFVGETILFETEGRIGLFGPFIIFGGVVLGAGIDRQLGIQGLDGYLTSTLLLNSWDGLTASNAGVYPQIVGSIIIIGTMAILAFPVGIGAATYLEEYAPAAGWRGRLASLLEVNISNLAGVPSVVYGLLGLALFRNTLGFGTGIVVSAAATLGLLILPIVVVSAQEALRSVPDSVRDASYGMGASRWQTLRNVVLPEAIPGILTGTILALARAIGETAPLVIIAVATTTYTPPAGLFSVRRRFRCRSSLPGSNVDPAFRHGVVPATAVVLLVLMLLMNATAIVVRNRYEPRPVTNE